MVQNKTLIFKAVPTGFPKAGEHLTVEDIGFDLDASPPENGVFVKVFYASFDPYQRGRMRAPNTKSYAPAFEVGKPIYNAAIAKVIKSNSSKFKEGDIIVGPAATGEYATLSAKDVETARKIENPHNLDLKVFLGPLGMPGLTAYSSFHEFGDPKEGETIFISAASGAVGQLVGQYAKREGLKVIGSVGDDKKLDYILNELGFDGGFNYKKEKPADALQRLAPNGIDIYFENVGGEQLEAALSAMNTFGRVVVCGMISQYNLPLEEQYPIRNLTEIIKKRLRIQGFIVGDANCGPKRYGEFVSRVPGWLADGSVKSKIHETVGIDNAIEGFLGMFEGKNYGKAVLKVADPE